ncbi:hypothetical protein [Krasilnikovia sp. MM14-A1259]|uniref:DUF6197 family protein n=1 Tax=Krasilnikovia sp. MM14-A1259 TaxID=3373539 RepID=UPI00382154FC
MHRTENPTGPAADTDENTTVTPATTLRGAARYLTTYGWATDDYYAFIATDTTQLPPCCALGAIGMAAYGRRTEDPFACIDPALRGDFTDAVDVLTEYLTLTVASTDWVNGGVAEIDVAVWNDEHGRTAEQVIAALNAAADDYDQRHITTTDLDAVAADVPLLDSGGYLACGCHGTQPEHTCQPF